MRHTFYNQNNYDESTINPIINIPQSFQAPYGRRCQTTEHYSGCLSVQRDNDSKP